MRPWRRERTSRARTPASASAWSKRKTRGEAPSGGYPRFDYNAFTVNSQAGREFAVVRLHGASRTVGDPSSSHKVIYRMSITHRRLATDGTVVVACTGRDLACAPPGPERAQSRFGLSGRMRTERRRADPQRRAGRLDSFEQAAFGNALGHGRFSASTRPSARRRPEALALIPLRLPHLPSQGPGGAITALRDKLEFVMLTRISGM